MESAASTGALFDVAASRSDFAGQPLAFGSHRRGPRCSCPQTGPQPTRRALLKTPPGWAIAIDTPVGGQRLRPETGAAPARSSVPGVA